MKMNEIQIYIIYMYFRRPEIDVEETIDLNAVIIYAYEFLLTIFQESFVFNLRKIMLIYFQFKKKNILQHCIENNYGSNKELL